MRPFLPPTREETNLYIFLTPHVREGPKEAKEMFDGKSKQMNKLEEGNIKLYNEKEGIPLSDIMMTD